MMYQSPNQQIEEEAQKSGAVLELLSIEDSTVLRKSVEERYALSAFIGQFRMCECLTDPYTVTRVEVGQIPPYKSFIGNQTVLLFFDNFEEPKMRDFIYLINDGFSVQHLAEECGYFTFYITNPTLDFLIAFSEEEYLFCAGTAHPWLSNYLDLKN